MTNRRGSRGPTKENKLRVSPKIGNTVSEYRKAQIIDDLENGNLQEGNSYRPSTLNAPVTEPNPVLDGNYKRGSWEVSDGGVSTGGRKSAAPLKESLHAIGSVAHSPEYKIKKQADVGSSSGFSSSSGAAVDRLAPEVYSPLFTMANLNLPRDRITINAWCRNFFELHPIVRNAITLHATYPISKMNLKCHDRKVLQFFEDMTEEMDLMTTLGEMSLDYWKLGEVFPYAELNENLGKWDRIIVQNPDYINVRKTVLSGDPLISLRPDAVLQRLVMSNNPADVQIRKKIPEKILYHVRKGQAIPLDNFNVSHLKMLSSPYDVRGTSIIVSVFKDLMLYDKVRESKFAQADDLINPITLILVGGNTDGEYRATQEDLDYFKTMFEEATYDKNFKLVTHAGVDVKRVGASGQVLEIASDMELIVKNIYTGLMVPQAVVDTESAVYASASIGLEVLRQRYFNFRNMMAKWLVNKIFAPISEINGFFEYKEGMRRLIVPEVEWNKMNLYDLQDYIGNLTGLVGSKQASVQTLYKSLGLNYEDERVKMRKESIDLVIRQKEEQAMAQMSLSELQALDPEKPILDPVTESPVEKEVPPEAGAPLGGAEALPELAPSPGGPLDMGGGGEGGMMPSMGPGMPSGPSEGGGI